MRSISTFLSFTALSIWTFQVHAADPSAPPAAMGTGAPLSTPAQAAAVSADNIPVPPPAPPPPRDEPPQITPERLLEGLDLSSIENVKQMRDPFHPPLIFTRPTSKSELEQFPTTQYTIVAVITGPRKLRALITAPSGKNYVISEKDKIGQREGVVKKITTEWIRVQEKVVNALGEEEGVTTYIRFKQANAPGASVPQVVSGG